MAATSIALQSCVADAGTEPFEANAQDSSDDDDINRVDKPFPSVVGGADALAALAFLCLLERSFRGRPWPTTKVQMASFLESCDPSYTPYLQGWLEQVEHPKAARKKLLQQFRRFGCCAGQGTQKKMFKWNLKVIKKLLVQYEQGATDQQPITPKSRSIAAEPPSHSAPVVLVDTQEHLDRVRLLEPFARVLPGVGDEQEAVAIDCEGVPENLFLIQVATKSTTYIFDCVQLAVSAVCEVIGSLLIASDVLKLFHDLHMDAVALAVIGGVEPLAGCFDTQLAMESLVGELHMGFNSTLEQLGLAPHPTKRAMKQRMDDGSLFAQRPISKDVLEYAVADVVLLLGAKDRLIEVLGDAWVSVQRASDARALLAPRSGGARQICFDVTNDYAIVSLELLKEQRPNDMEALTPLVVSDETHELMSLLPEDLAVDLRGRTDTLSDISLDLGRSPQAWINGERVFLGGDERRVEQRDIDMIVDELGGFGTDNRAGLERQLHRISAIRNRTDSVIGLTMRIGRHVSGNAAMILDLLFGDSARSILFLGEPGSGKTTVVREATRLLAARVNAIIVDTSNEIAGDGDVPHPCVGLARRMMVPSLDEQANVMIECVQNHTPEVMIIDEIGRTTEVEAARTCKQRGVRLIASAHGDLRKLVKNPKIRGPIGGIEQVTIGDAEAKKHGGSKLVTQVGVASGSVVVSRGHRVANLKASLHIMTQRRGRSSSRRVLLLCDAVARSVPGRPSSTALSSFVAARNTSGVLFTTPPPP